MVAVAEMEWQDLVDGTFPEHPARQAWRDAVATVAEKARAALPESNGRIESAVKIVLAGDVEVLEDGRAQVASQSNGQTVYHVVNGECSCKDFPKAPQSMCKHRIAYGIHKRATTLVRAQMQPHDIPATPVAPVSNVPPAPLGASIPAWALVELHGKQFVTFGGLLAMAHERGLVSLKAEFVTVTAELALAHAVATFADGRTFEDSADATPANVNSKIRPHFPRMALTRAKARALRDALNIATVAVEELEA